MDENVKKVSRWASRNGWAVGSHIHHGLFLVSRPLPGGELGANSRDWRVASIVRAEDGKGRKGRGARTFEVEEIAHPLKNAAHAVLQKKLAEKGISPSSAPTVSLKGVKAFPVNALD